MKLVVVLCLGILSQIITGHKLHPRPKNLHYSADNEENDSDFWNQNALDTLNKVLVKKKSILGRAKNVILFLGDGMSVPTLAATRAYMGNENSKLSFDDFPNTAISKTYCVDYQVPDSACTSTAYLCGVKGNMGTIGVNGNVQWGKCQTQLNTSNHVNSIAYDFQQNGRASGLVTTARVTHASPAGVYAHIADRDWEADSDQPEDAKDCPDIATQLVTEEIGKNLNVIMGGGRAKFLQRGDKVNLVEKWQKLRTDSGNTFDYVENKTQMSEVQNVDYVLGLFSDQHMDYNLERDNETQPSLEEMTEAAIKVLSRNDKGYFLFVEGAEIDMGHHENFAQKALDETVEFSKAVQRAVDLTDEKDTLIVVTSDHSHTMSFAGYPERGHDILGVMSDEWGDGIPYTTLAYANGPGYRAPDPGAPRHDPSKDDRNDPNYRFPAAFFEDSEGHGGDDVIIFAKGPWAHLFAGVMEENVIPHIMRYSSCVGSFTDCKDRSGTGDASHISAISIIFLIISSALAFFL